MPEARPVDPAALKPHPPRPRAPASPEPAASPGVQGRRTFVAWSIAGFLATLVVCFGRFFYPRALLEPKTRFAIGYPGDYGFGVDARWLRKHRIWVVRSASGLFVIHARCTHLGCTPEWRPAENKFACPCHGSGFDAEGLNYEGPAPKPMLRCHLELDPTGQVVVDTLNLYDYDGGTKNFKDVAAGRSGPLLAV